MLLEFTKLRCGLVVQCGAWFGGFGSGTGSRRGGEPRDGADLFCEAVG